MCAVFDSIMSCGPSNLSSRSASCRVHSSGRQDASVAGLTISQRLGLGHSTEDLFLPWLLVSNSLLAE